jgi:ferritin
MIKGGLMLSDKIQKALNEQINEENHASHYYLSMASWCDKKGFHGAAGFLYAHAEQERSHMMKLFRYVNDAGGHALVGSLKEPVSDFKSLPDIMDLVLKNEQHVTKLINALVEKCLSEKDYSTFNFLQWYVSEQHEEERLFNSVLDLIHMTGTDGKGLFFIDKEIGSLAGKVNKAG